MNAIQCAKLNKRGWAPVRCSKECGQQEQIFTQLARGMLERASSGLLGSVHHIVDWRFPWHRVVLYVLRVRAIDERKYQIEEIR